MKICVEPTVWQMKDTGSVDLKTSARGRKPSLSPEDVENIRQTVLDEMPQIALMQGGNERTLTFWACSQKQANERIKKRRREKRRNPPHDSLIKILWYYHS